MATQNRRGYGNPYGSADLGSGVRTTTGGSYRNPRLGIEDTTAFGRGFASTFRMPKIEEEKEKQKLKGIQLGTWDDEGNDFHKDAEGNTWDANLNASILANTNWTNGELATLQKAYESGDERTKGRIQSHMNGYNMAIGLKGSFTNYRNAVGDSQLNDSAASNRGLPDENGVLSNYNMADFNKWGNEDPNSIEVASKPNDHNIIQYGYTHKPTGTFINATAMTPEFIQKNIKLKYSQIDSLTEDYKSSNITKFKPMFHSSGTKLFQGTADEYQVKVDNKYVQEGTIYNFDKISRDAAMARFSTANDAFFDSALVSLDQKLKEGFMPSEDLYKRLKDSGGKIDNQLKLDLLKDHYTEQFKLNNGSDMYVLDPDTGRAVAKTYDNRRFFDPNYMKTERDLSGDGGDGSGIAGGFISNISNLITDVIGVGTAGTAPAGWQKKQIDNQKAMEMLERVEKRDKVSYLNLQDEASVSRWIKAVSKEIDEDYTREDLYNSLTTKKPSSQHHHIVQIDWSGTALEASPVDFDGTIGSLSGDFARAYGLTGTKKDNFHNQIDKLIGEFGGDIDKYNSWAKGLSPKEQKNYSPIIK
jgi:hypothetical protein